MNDTHEQPCETHFGLVRAPPGSDCEGKKKLSRRVLTKTPHLAAASAVSRPLGPKRKNDEIGLTAGLLVYRERRSPKRLLRPYHLRGSTRKRMPLQHGFVSTGTLPDAGMLPSSCHDERQCFRGAFAT
eukprot:CAMPEP_0167818792 /NCGR_PEP_ID=MMETSP0112_2-20121227/5034_1 /TAXON_ID=91324 /ORGANISM="Lotharella globosa, Strain CCCM811" /LENGTH=127 /DNA_ID=CAMNT_0007718881 /DNA_START=267 /DNA_END=650 /DNA_ORIENTATION=-